MLYPTTLLDELAFQLKAALCCGGVVPEPLADCAMEPLEALLANVILAEAAPDVVGENVTENDRLYPVGIVTGNVVPVTENSASLEVPLETVTGPFVAVSVADRLWLVPSTTLPKFTVAGDTANCPGALPVPVSATVSVGSEALELTTRLPVALPPV